ncbi:MAG: DUF885 domain-containing protein [Acidobacteria bacterium]|nr:MAG: DUF885 domain-containing protein [Acidobacteriota bacterium]
MRNLACFLLAVSVCSSAQAQSASVAERVAKQNALFEEFYETGLKNAPERATSVGDYRYNALLADVSPAAIARQHAENDAFLARLRAIPTDGMGEPDRLSHEVLERQLTRAEVNYELKNYEMPINQQNGVHTALADLPLSVPLDSVKHYEDYIARLHQIPRVLAQTTEVLRAGLKDGLMPPKLVLDQLPKQCAGIVAEDPFLLPLKKLPASFSDAEKQRLTAAMTQAVNEDVLPAYRKFAEFLGSEYAPRGRTVLSIESLPDGKRRYVEAVKANTTIDITPEAVHALGLSEVARITAEMTELAHAQGYKDLAAFRAAIKSDPRWTPKNEEQIVADFKKYIDQMQPRLPELFGLLPKAPVTVEGIPAFQAAASTHYVRGTPDGKRAGRVVVAVADPTHRTLVLDEAVAYHEGVPGHHMQISVAQQLQGLPKFRLLSTFFSAYTEGWALYAEQLGKEIGFYKDPVSDYGRLSSELFRAVRLVVDTGIHDKGWSRDQVIAYMHANDVNDVVAQAETDRYIAWPGQALAYKMGQLKIRELRERAKKQLGPRFDIKAFHDEVLDGGALPLDLLEARVDGWIKGQAR